MNDPANPNNSYVDSYTPPVTQVAGSSNSMPAPALDAAPEPVVGPTDSTPMNQPVDQISSSSMPATPNPTLNTSQSLEDQNIFFLLGVEDIADEEKEAFLDELQQVIWEDFLENDVQLLITENEDAELKTLMDKDYDSDLDKQEAIVVYLEKLIPDLEEVMLEKAMGLKQEMVDERLVSMREVFTNEPEALQVIDKASALIKDDQWRQAAELLNDLQSRRPAA